MYALALLRIRSKDAGEGITDARRAPAFGRRGRAARAANIGPFPFCQGHGPSARPDPDAAVLHEHPEHAVAGAGKETRTAHRDEAKGAANLHRGRRASGWSI